MAEKKGEVNENEDKENQDGPLLDLATDRPDGFFTPLAQAAATGTDPAPN